MDLRRLRLGEWMAGVFGAALLGALFLPWFAQRVECARPACPSAPLSGWNALAVLDVLLALVAVMGLCTFVAATAYRTPAVPTALSSLLSLLGTVFAVALVVRVAVPPDGADRLGGVWLGVAALIGVTAGGWVAIRDESYGFWPSQDASSGRPERARAVEVTHLPAPAPRSDSEVVG